MRKRISTQNRQEVYAAWLDLAQLAEVEVTSEEPEHPIEAALLPNDGSGWRAADCGEQTLRLLFDHPQQISRIRLLFQEDQQARTQEFLLRYSRDKDKAYQEIVRQQYTFSPPGTTRELEDYKVDLAGVLVLELTIVPEIGGGQARASVAQWQVA